MGPPLTPGALSDVRAKFAHAILGAAPSRSSVGAVTLMPHQREAVARAQAAIARYRGVIIADDVGTGKTFIALALAARYDTPVVLAPACLRDTWEHAAARAKMSVPFITLESLSRARPRPARHDVVIADEAHHLRNPATRRYRAAMSVAQNADVVLISGTPVHNVARDLEALLALFLHEDARDLGDEARAEIIVRTSARPVQPGVIVHASRAIADAPEIVRAIEALPTAVRTADGGEASALLRIAFLRAWCSSVGALAQMARRAYLNAAALVDALRAGRHLTRVDLSTWTGTGDGQLAFAELIGMATGNIRVDLPAATAHIAALEELRSLARAYSTLDDHRAQCLGEIAATHPGIPVLACTQYSGTVDSLWHRMRTVPGAAALTAHGGRIATGPMSRDQVLARFAPVARSGRTPHARERISVLLTTDVVSEGVNLQDAGVIIHLDLPWTAARLAQRVGRIARVGSPHEKVHAYTIAPPRAAARLLALERRIRSKRHTAARVAGGGARFAELLGGIAPSTESPAESRARIVRMLTAFAPEPFEQSDAVASLCAVTAPRSGWLAMSSTDGGARLFACLSSRGGATTAPHIVAKAVEVLTTGRDCPLPADWRRAANQANRWLEREFARELAGAGRVHAALVRGHTLAMSALSVRDAPPHERARVANSASETMRAGAGRRPNGSALRSRLSALVVFVPHEKTRNPV